MTPNQERAYRAALTLIAQGLHCFFCAEDKRPTSPHGFKDATANPGQLRALSIAHPGSLIGVCTGQASDLFVLDIDKKHPESVQWLAANEDRLPTTRIHRTRSGGRHYLFRHHAGMRCTASRIARGVDTRDEGGYIVWWPAQGCAVLCDAPIADAPDWLIQALLRPPPPPHSNAAQIRICGDRRALRGLIRVVATAREGERNKITYWAACRAGEMVAGGKLTEPDAIAFLVEAASRTGLPRDEALRTARSGLRAVRR